MKHRLIRNLILGYGLAACAGIFALNHRGWVPFAVGRSGLAGDPHRGFYHK